MSSTADKNGAASILSQISDIGQSYLKDEPGARESLIDLSQALLAALELPSEFIQRMGRTEVRILMLLAGGVLKFYSTAFASFTPQNGTDLNLFELLKHSGKEGASSKTLAEKTGADEILLSRLMKHLAASRVIHEKAADVYTGSVVSDALVEPKYRDGVIWYHDVVAPTFHALPDYLKSIKYGHPTEKADGPFQYAHKTELPVFQWLDRHPHMLSAFNSYMSAHRAGKPNWYDPGFYPITERLIRTFNTSNSDVLLVDVGGGLGHDLHAFRASYPSAPGKLILQDRQEVIANVPPQETFSPQAHDFFTPHPVIHAKAYYLRSVLHNWFDDDCLRILKNLIPALKPGYSKVLVDEIVVAEENASLAATSMDQLVFVLGAMKERTEREWRDMFEMAGFEVVGIWRYPGVGECVMELEHLG